MITAKDYLKRAYLLDKQINVEIQEMELMKSSEDTIQYYTKKEIVIMLLWIHKINSWRDC